MSQFVDDKLTKFCQCQDEDGSVIDYELEYSQVIDGELETVRLTLDLHYTLPPLGRTIQDGIVVSLCNDGFPEYNFTITRAVYYSENGECELTNEQLQHIQFML